MAQYDVHENWGSNTFEIPYLLDAQHPMLGGLATRVVIPLVALEAFPLPARGLNPTFEVEGRRVVLSTAELAGVPASLLGPVRASLAGERSAIVAALDLVFTGP